MKKEELYQICMKFGQATGCHQRPERSFFFRGMQFPVCARCTGVFIGEILGVLLFKIGEISILTAIIFCLIMLLDWGIQYATHHESNNFRRLISGLLCGYAFMDLLLKFFRWVIELLAD